MASTPDASPDSPPAGAPDDVERVARPDRDRAGVEDAAGADDSAVDGAGDDGGTSGTGGTNHRSDRETTS